MTTGIFGGTFDPPHLGHLLVAEFARAELGLDRVLFIPAASPPHKTHVNVTPPVHRLAMVRLAVQRNSAFVVDDREIRRGGVSYTLDTLNELSVDDSLGALVLLIGQDNMLEFSTWKSPEQIVELARVVVLTRPGFSLESRPPLSHAMTLCEVPEIDISSRDIRRRVREGLSIRYLVPEAVASYIGEHHLYTG